MVEHKLAACLDRGDIDEALRLDQVRREIQQVYNREGGLRAPALPSPQQRAIVYRKLGLLRASCRASAWSIAI